MTIICPFCEISEWILENEYARMRLDANPVSPGHALVVSKRHVADYFELSTAEVNAVWSLVAETKKQLAIQHSPAGFNVGINVGTAAGQTIPHAHIHIIPRYEGDVPDPRGGVRGVFPAKKLYPSCP